MPTTSTIGTTGRTYSTMQAWEDAVPATPTGGYIGEMYNDSEFSGRCDIAGHTTGASDYITLTAATGQSFQDHAGVRSNALYYDQSKGVGINTNQGTGVGVITVDNDYVTISRLQIKGTNSNYGTGSVLHVNNQGQPNILIKDCIVVKTYATSSYVVQVRSGRATNLLIVNTHATVGYGLGMYQLYAHVGRALNCTVVNTAAAGGTGIQLGGASDPTLNTINNCAVFGFSTAADTGSGNYNATDLASGLPGANSAYNKTASTEFESATVDFRLKSGATMIAAGNTDATNAPNDISGYARGTTTAGDVGAWEATAASAPTYGVSPAVNYGTSKTVRFTATATAGNAGNVTHYLVGVSDGATAPTGAEVIAGHGAAPDDNITVASGAVANLAISLPSLGTAYDAYFVAVDTLSNASAPVKVDFTTEGLANFTNQHRRRSD